MKKHLSLLFLFSSCFVFALSGCQKPADSSSTSSAPDGSTPTTGSDTSDPAMKAAAPRPEAKPILVPAETVLTVVLDQEISSKTASAGQTFTATVQAPVEVDDRLAIPKGSAASGVIKDAKSAGRFKGGAVLSLTLTSITINGHEHEIQTTAPTESSTGKGKRTAAMVGGGAGGGALIGGVAGGGKGALIGGLIGAAAGTGGAGLTGNRDITLAAETPLTFKLVEPLEIKRR
jgi:hypothetical protein